MHKYTQTHTGRESNAAGVCSACLASEEDVTFPPWEGTLKCDGTFYRRLRWRNSLPSATTTVLKRITQASGRSTLNPESVLVTPLKTGHRWEERSPSWPCAWIFDSAVQSCSCGDGGLHQRVCLVIFRGDLNVACIPTTQAGNSKHPREEAAHTDMWRSGR